jgi:hypothetical protein
MATGEPYGWNIVVMGAWNVAILTPDGIRRRLFELPDGTPVEVQIAIDLPAPPRVRHGGLMVAPSASALEISLIQADKASMLRAAGLAKRTLLILPETPVSAVGVNIRYQFAVLPDELINLVKAPIDTELSDAGFSIEGGMTRRSLTLAPGLLNVEVTQGKMAEGTITLNFHRDSANPGELASWLSSTGDFLEQSEKFLARIKANVQIGEA